MKLASTLLLLAAASTGLLATETATAPAAASKPSCCAPAKPEPASCCAAKEPMAAAAPLSDRSLYQLGATWTDDRGANVSLTSLRGKPVVLAMFFASCEYACPVLVSDMQRLRALLPDATRDTTQFVLVTFDTARDTPAVLKTYRERAALGKNWTLLRGDDSAVQELAMLLGVKYKQDARGEFAHSNLITVLNGEGEVVHQHAGLMGDVSEAAKAAASAATTVAAK